MFLLTTDTMFRQSSLSQNLKSCYYRKRIKLWEVKHFSWNNLQNAYDKGRKLDWLKILFFLEKINFSQSGGKNAYYYAFFGLTHLDFGSLILVLFREKIVLLMMIICLILRCLCVFDINTKLQWCFYSKET